jgi:hypothetical protein
MFIDDTYLLKTHKKTIAIAIAMMCIPFVLVIVGELALKNVLAIEPLEIYETIKYILIAMTAIEIVLMIIFKNQIISGTGNLALHNQKKGLNKEDAFIDRLFFAFIVIFSICNSIAIYGLILFLIGHDSSIFLGFTGTSFFLMLAQFPKREDWESRLKQFIEDEADTSLIATLSNEA